MSQALYTIGFTRKGAERFFRLLEEAEVRLVLDIRARPDPQLAGFARGRDLAWLLRRLSGIDYLPVPALAPGRALLDAHRRGALDWPAYAQRYVDELEPAEVHRQLNAVDLQGACLLCAEADPTHCHRRLAAEWLQRGDPALHVVHLR